MLTLILLRNGILLAVVLAVALSTASAQDESQFPYQALILNDDVTIRSGPDDSYYATDKLHRGTTVVVHRHHTGGWCAIGPPEGSFSLVPAAAVEVTDSNAGIVRGSDVQVWVGTCLGHVDDPHSQIMLRANQRVEILGEISWPSPDGESTSVWYQVAPPEGELRWIQLSDLQLPSYLTVQPEPTSNADKTPAAQFNAQTIPEVDLGFSQNEIAPVSAQSVIEPMQGLSDPQLAQPNWLPQQTPTGSDFGQYGNNATTPGNTLGDNPFVQSAFQSQQQSSEVGSNFYSTNDDFSQGLVVIGKDAALKIGGYVKLDLIYDFNPIDATDTFVVSSIPIGAPPRTNSRMHVRQTRLNFDTRWKTRCGTARAFVEGDFFGANNETDSDDFRLRQAFGELGRFLGGQTWTTFANIAAAPATLK